jgi:hypothetical protein
VPPLLLESDADRRRYIEGEARNRLRLAETERKA